MDQGIWATWYDLPEGARDAHLAWLHGEYLPGLSQRPGFAWVAHYASQGGGTAMRHLRDSIVQHVTEDVPAGSQFLLLAGAASANTFLAPSVLELEHNAAPAERAMLDQRQAVRTAIFAEQARVNGPEFGAQTPGGTPAPAIQMGSFRAHSVEEEFDLGAWYAQYRLPHMARMPGCIGARKLLCVAGWAKHAVLYEFTSLDARLEHFEEKHEALGQDDASWSGRISRYTLHVPGSPTVAERTWPPRL